MQDNLIEDDMKLPLCFNILKKIPALLSRDYEMVSVF